eukprot:867780-Pleurochrysis_carterae.AAC.1
MIQYDKEPHTRIKDTIVFNTVFVRLNTTCTFEPPRRSIQSSVRLQARCAACWPCNALGRTYCQCLSSVSTTVCDCPTKSAHRRKARSAYARFVATYGNHTEHYIDSVAKHTTYVIARIATAVDVSCMVRILVAETNAAASAVAAPAIDAVICALDIKGMQVEPTMRAFSEFHREIDRLNRSLPASNRLADSLVADKMVNAGRKVSNGMRTMLDVQLTVNRGWRDLDTHRDLLYVWRTRSSRSVPPS